MHIWVDADAYTFASKELLYRVEERMLDFTHLERFARPAPDLS